MYSRNDAENRQRRFCFRSRSTLKTIPKIFEAELHLHQMFIKKSHETKKQASGYFLSRCIVSLTEFPLTYL
jgi:hypothetical protein